ncbi:BON domain-containing protein [Anaeromyxobacter sp. Fw109-5]|uniref:BON domain-containing protein n=1 Tax=Anaeromyxobacter sp. (strain Fw109-5) TaxID=404589 RepID=UPI0000ED89E0|nr:BON domain-containing protein [Anaeromyxobacter sp. Fw109-5]ABS27340.1 transport-associated [Anaeromyxobacter sp. Fw109-5]
MTRYGGWEDPRWDERERAAGERGYGEARAGRWREREELDPPWVERGPYARSADADTRGLIEWEDRGPLAWMGERAREATGKRPHGPKGYRRADDRIQDAVCERIARSPVDASDVEVKVENGEVTLTGTVRSRREKWWLEELVEGVFGVEDVHDHLRVARTDAPGQETGPGRSTH